MSHGGWRHGAGRPARRPRIEDCLVLDVRRLRAMGALVDGDHGALDVGDGRCWWYRTRAGWLVLRREVDGKAFQAVKIDATATNLGIGKRMWLRCPIETCGRRCMRLYMPPGSAPGFACARCACVSYPSQRLSAYDAASRRCDEAMAKLGPGGSRPRGMHYRTYVRLRGELLHAERERVLALAAQAGESPGNLAAIRWGLEHGVGEPVRRR